MNSELNEKLNKFSAIILSDAQKMRREIEEECSRIKEERISKVHDELLIDAYEKIQRTVSSIYKDDNEKVQSARNSAKKEILTAREKMIDEVFSEAEKRIFAFTDTDLYDNWLAENIIKVDSQTGTGRKTLFVREKDKKRAENAALKTKDPKNICITGTKSIIFGGIKLKNEDKNIIADLSFDSLLESERNEFLQKSGLSVD